MNFNKHYDLEGQHAFLSASKYHWLNYDDNKLVESYSRALAVQKGTVLHDFARQCIELGQRLPKKNATLNMYVNDAIGYKMKPEQVLYYSENCFGTADAISFKKDFLRIHDLKTGVTPAKIEQLLIYSALFCLEYAVKPSSIAVELRIYQNNDIILYTPESLEIEAIMAKIRDFDKLINKVKLEEEG